MNGQNLLTKIYKNGPRGQIIILKFTKNTAENKASVTQNFIIR